MNRRSYYKWCKIGKPVANNYKQEIADVISEEHKSVKGIYGTIRLKTVSYTHLTLPTIA